MTASLFVDLHLVISQTALLIGQSAIDQFFKLLNPERLELENLRARNERAVDVKKRIVSRCADQPQISASTSGQENVLLRFVEMMDLVDEQDRFLTGRAQTVGRRSDDAAHFSDITFNAA